MRIINKVENHLVALIIFTTASLVFINVIFRLFNIGISWSDELIRYLLIWVTFIGISISVREGTHISVDAVPELLKGNYKKIIYGFIYTISILFTLLLLYYSVEFATSIYSSGQNSPSLRVPMYLVYLIIPISALLMFIGYIQKIIELFKSNL